MLESHLSKCSLFIYEFLKHVYLWWTAHPGAWNRSVGWPLLKGPCPSYTPAYWPAQCSLEVKIHYTVKFKSMQEKFYARKHTKKINLMHNCQIITNHKYFSANQPLSYGCDKNTGLIRFTRKLNCCKPVYIL